MKLKRIFSLCALVLTSGTFSYAGGSFAAFPPDWYCHGGPGAAFKSELSDVVYDGARAQALKLTCLPKRTDGKPAREERISQAWSLNLANYQAITFKAKFTSTGAAKEAVKFSIVGGASRSLEFSKENAESGPDKEGFYSFKWDIGELKQPTINERFDFHYDTASLGEGDKLEVTIIDLAFRARSAESADQVGSGQFSPFGKGVAAKAEVSPWVKSRELERLKLPLEGWTLDVKEAAPGVQVKNVEVKVGTKTVPALQLTYKHGEKFSAVSLPFKINADEHNVFTFKAKVEIPAGVKALGDVEAPMTGWFSQQFNEFFDNFGVSMQDALGLDWTEKETPHTHFLQHLDKSQPVENGFKTFIWDMKNENRSGNKGFDLEEVTGVKFFYDNRKIKPGDQVVITIIDPHFVKGLSKSGGDMEKYAAFRKAMDAYKPDYSDSSKYLGAPEQGRLPEPLQLVKDGRAQGEIVGQASVWGAEGNAVLELYHWLYRLTGGARLPVATSPTEADNVKIFVGSAYAASLFKEDIEFLKGSDGCAIRTRGNNVYIFGASPKGTLNGVYTFLEANSDIIWPRPSAVLGAVYTENPSLAVTWGNYRHRPKARNWGWMGAVQGPQFDYQVRNRANYLGLRSSTEFQYWGLFMEEGGGHNLHTYIPGELFETHPEYWSLLNGKRQRPNHYFNQICTTNEEGRKVLTNRFLEVIGSHPQAKIANCYNLKIEDNWGTCECDECVRPIRLADGTLLDKDDIAFRSTQFFMFLNEVANAVHNNGYPQMQIGTYVYFYTVPVPKIPVTKQLRPYFCDYVRKDHKVPIFAPINDIWWKILNEWTKVSDKVVVREYTGIYVFFRPLAEVAAYDIKAELEAGAYEFTSERLFKCSTEHPVTSDMTTRNIDVSSMEYWVITRLYWDPEADVEQLRKYFIRRTYREAAPEMEKFYGVIRELYFKEKRTTDFEEFHETLRLVIAKNRDTELDGYLKSALQNVKHPLARQMVQQVDEAYSTWIAELKAKKSLSDW